MKKKRWGWLGLAVVLLAVAAWLMSSPEDFTPNDKKKVAFPRNLRPKEYDRMVKRQTAKTPAPKPRDDAEEPAPWVPPRRDPVLAALSSKTTRTAVVIEANAIRHSPIGQLLIDCIEADEAEGMKKFQDETGINPVEDLDRVMVSENTTILTGHFGNARWEKVFEKMDATPYGERARIYSLDSVVGASAQTGRRRAPQVIATWDNQAVLIGKDEAEVKAMIDRMNGTSTDDAPPLITEQQTYGEIYGVVDTEDLARMLPKDQAELAQRLRETTDRVELHADTQSDVALVADVRGPDGAKVSDLGKTIGAALSVGRMKAMADSDDELAELLDYAKVNRRDGSFSLEVALPMAVLERQLADCKRTEPVTR